MSNYQVKTVFSRFRKYISERIGCEVLKLIYIKIKVLSFLLGHTDTLHGGELNFGNNHSAQKRGVVFPHSSFGYVYQKNFSVIHYLRDIERGFCLPDNISYKRSV